jgi:hypothetical protein
MSVDKEYFNEVKSSAEDLYKKLREIYCPFFDEKISFNAKGLDHIKLKEWNKTRTIEDQYLRLKFLYLVPEIIKKSHTLQEYREQINFERQKINSRWEKRMVKVKYYAFIAILEGVRIKVIIKEINGGSKNFWSIYPFWKQAKGFDGKNKKALFEGDLEIQ